MKPLRAFVSCLAAAALIVPASQARAEAPPERNFTVGIVQVTDAIVYDDAVVALRSELEQLGYVRGKNLTIKRRVVLGKTKGLWDKVQILFALHSYIDEFVATNVDLVVTVGTPATLYGAERAHDKGLRVMFMGVSYPDALEFLKDGWLTGTSTFVHPERIINLIHAGIPSIKSLALAVSDDPNARGFYELLEPVAAQHGIRLFAYDVKTNSDAVGAAEYFNAVDADAYLVIPDTWIARDELVNAHYLIDNYVRRKNVPVIGTVPEMIDVFPDVVAVSVGVRFSTTGTRSAGVVDRILNGTPPGQIPVSIPERPLIRVRKGPAKKSGLQITATLLGAADQVDE